MRLVLEIPDDKHALMLGVAKWQDKELDQYINEALTEVLASDLDAASTDQRKSKPIRELK